MLSYVFAKVSLPPHNLHFTRRPKLQAIFHANRYDEAYLRVLTLFPGPTSHFLWQFPPGFAMIQAPGVIASNRTSSAEAGFRAFGTCWRASKAVGEKLWRQC